MSSHLKLAAAGVLLSGLIAAAGCSQPAETPEPATAEAAPTSPDVQRFRVGSLELVALRDGGLTGLPNDNTVLAVGQTPEEVSALLTSAGLPGDTLDLSIQPLLVRDGQRLVLIDAGGGASMGANAGKLVASLAAADVQPGQITDILISHGHGDHVAGLVDGAGALTFPNATIRMTAAEWTAIQADAPLAALVTAITPKVETFEPGAQITPAIKAYAIDGHTPGHTGYELSSGDERLVYIGDAMHHSVISVQQPTWTIAFDGDEATAEASRQALLSRAASENLLIYAVHFPYPGVGRIQRREDTFVWVPETPAS
ncbi:MBL fold metallo-hydrolase [Brevundimonas aurifodinae]|uniref:MBL fold metallo-hydrolase n=2 Tax=Brevundimonas TaxID=41275 RepID=A0ABV1NRA5_9CAUL|nr:MAG: MBL fold metallo-hydrolase [Brevundimonas sp. 12-68-7]OYX35039.1 MAG: MBL fold metallo-hydrolase [Brevundimonas subvibrioides]